MCGICGFAHQRKMDENVLIAMNRQIAYRGPDDEGYYIKPFGNDMQVGFAHRRLAILDLSSNGHQPMETEDSEVVITYNGEVYNFETLRQELEAAGHIFKSKTDTEVILHAYLQWGIKCVNKFNGMFAFAIFDKKAKTVYLARDRMGVKPLYYFVDGVNIAFASELKPLLQYPYVTKQIRRGALIEYLAKGYITGPQTIFESIYKLMPGEILQWTPSGRKTFFYWSIQDTLAKQIPFQGAYEEACAQLETLLLDAVKLRMISDVPVGAFLSNGVDSSLVVAMMQKVSNTPVNTFTIGFAEPDFDEAKRAKEVAKYLGTNHREYILSVNETENYIEKIPQFFDEPLADPSDIATMLVSCMARQEVTVALTGDAGDELFCGYKPYGECSLYRKFRLISKILAACDRHTPIGDLLRRARSYRLNKLLYMDTDLHTINAGFLSQLDLNANLIQGTASYNDHRGAVALGRTLPDRWMISDMLTWLPDDILTKVDRASMSVSLETRAPLLDWRVVEFALGLPLSYKMSGGGVQKTDIKGYSVPLCA